MHVSLTLFPAWNADTMALSSHLGPRGDAAESRAEDEAGREKEPGMLRTCWSHHTNPEPPTSRYGRVLDATNVFRSLGLGLCYQQTNVFLIDSKVLPRKRILSNKLEKHLVKQSLSCRISQNLQKLTSFRNRQARDVIGYSSQAGLSWNPFVAAHCGVCVCVCVVHACDEGV